MARSRVELFEAIRRDHRRPHLSIRGLADRYGVHRRTVRQALESAIPPERTTPVRAAPRLDPVKKPLTDAMLRKDLDAPKKQQYTARRVLARLLHEHDADITYSTVRDYVRLRRPEIGGGERPAARAGVRAADPPVLASRLVNELAEADNDRQLTKVIARYGRVDLLALDELGYLQLGRRGAELLFQVLSEREERNSIAIATNEPFSGWTKTFTDPRLCAAIVDRLTFGGHILETGTTIYRLAHTRARGAES